MSAGNSGSLAQQLINRELVQDDYAELVRLFESNNLDRVLCYFSPFPLTAETAARITQRTSLDHYYGCFLNDRLVGISLLRGWDEGYSVPSFGLMVDYRHYNQGIGTSLINYSIGEARRLGCRRIRLTVLTKNRTAVHLYKSQGFVEAGRHSETNSEESADKILMIKDL